MGTPDERCGLRRTAFGNRARHGVDDWTGDRNESITAPRHCLDEARFARVIVERCPQLADRRSKDRVGDELVSPYLIEQCVGREERAWLPRESAQHCEGCWGESDRGSIAKQARVGLVQLELVEAQSYRVRAS